MQKRKYSTVKIVKDKEMQRILDFYKNNGITITALTTALLKNFYKQCKNNDELQCFAKRIKNI